MPTPCRRFSVPLFLILVMAVLSPFASANDSPLATPVVDEPEHADPVGLEVSTPEPDLAEGESIVTAQGEPNVGTLNGDPPTLTMSGFTGTVSAPYGRQVFLEFPDGAEATSFNSADCVGDPAGPWTAGYDYDAFFFDITKSYRARWIETPSQLSNCVNVTWRGAPTVGVVLSGGPINPPTSLVAGNSVDFKGEFSVSSPDDAGMTHSVTITIAGETASSSVFIPDVDTTHALPFLYSDISPLFVNACIEGNMQISVGISSWFGTSNQPDPDYTFGSEYTQQIPCSITITPIQSLNIQEICANRDNQANDLVEFDLPTGVVLIAAEYTGSVYNIDVVPPTGYVFPDGMTEARFSHTDASQQCAPSLLTIDETSQVLVGIHPGDTVMIPATLTVPSDQPYTSASFSVLGDDDVSDDLSTTLQRGFAAFVPVDIALTTPENFAATCSAGGGSVLVDVSVHMSGPYILGELELEEASFDATGTLPCDVRQWVTPDINRITQTEVCGPQNDTFATNQPGVELVLGGWTGDSREISFIAADGFDLFGDVLTHRVTDANGQCRVDHLTILLDTSDGGSLEGGEWALWAPVASQANQPAYAEGVIGIENAIHIDDVVVGTYRFVIDAAGYERVDTTFVVSDDDPTEVITIAVTAIQIPTQTPVPTAIPTIEPTVIPTIAQTIEPTVVPTIEPTVMPTTVPTIEPTMVPTSTPTNGVVTRLPDTGSGNDTFIPLTLVSLLAALIMSTMALNNVRRER